VESASAHAPPGQLGKLIAVSILDDVEDIIVQPARRESVADGEQCIHTISGLIDLIILITSCVILSHSKDEIQNLHKDPDRVRVAAQHDIAEPHVVIRCNMAGGNASEGVL